MGEFYGFPGFDTKPMFTPYCRYEVETVELGCWHVEDSGPRELPNGWSGQVGDRQIMVFEGIRICFFLGKGFIFVKVKSCLHSRSSIFFLGRYSAEIRIFFFEA